MSRVFFLSSHICVGESGGGHGVTFRLNSADKKYRMFDQPVIYVFKDRIIEGYNDVGRFPEQKDIPAQAKWRVRIKKYIPSVLRISKMKKTFRGLEQYLDEIDKKYHFTDEDIFICHDFRFAYAFTQKYTYNNVVFVYHGQGSIYFEWRAETGIKSESMRRFFNSVFTQTTGKIRYLCFPSKGTEESLVSSEPVLKEAVASVEKKYLYNGVSCPDDVSEDDLPDWIREVAGFDGYKFVTVANLNEAKAIERIPQYLAALGKAGVNYRWVLVGNGVKAQEVADEIEKYRIGDRVKWMKSSVRHDDLMKLFSVTDFYILLHKFSIFDLSTLEAMHYGNIPVLTPVGGNKEMIIDSNGLFVDDFSDAAPFVDMIRGSDLQALKDKNVKIQNEMFNDKAFLQRYVDLCDSF